MTCADSRVLTTRFTLRLYTMIEEIGCEPTYDFFPANYLVKFYHGQADARFEYSEYMGSGQI